MPRSFDMATEYEGSVEQVHSAFSDERYWLARLSESGADVYSLDSIDCTNGGIDIVTTQTLRTDRLPAVVTQFHRGDLSFVREETWAPITDGSTTASVKGSITGAPATLRGTAILTPTRSGSGSRLKFRTTVEVNIPLVGGKIENFIGSQLVDLLIREQRFTTAWITENA